MAPKIFSTPRIKYFYLENSKFRSSYTFTTVKTSKCNQQKIEYKIGFIHILTVVEYRQ
jgi:hypothetical protein